MKTAAFVWRFKRVTFLRGEEELTRGSHPTSDILTEPVSVTLLLFSGACSERQFSVLLLVLSLSGTSCWCHMSVTWHASLHWLQLGIKCLASGHFSTGCWACFYRMCYGQKLFGHLLDFFFSGFDVWKHATHHIRVREKRLVGCFDFVFVRIPSDQSQVVRSVSGHFFVKWRFHFRAFTPLLKCSPHTPDASWHGNINIWLLAE